MQEALLIFCNHDRFGYQEREIIEAFLALPVPQRKIVREVILTFARAFPVEPADTGNP